MPRKRYDPTLATHSGANSGSYYVITVTHGSATAGTITLKGITTRSFYFDRLTVVAAADSEWVAISSTHTPS